MSDGFAGRFVVEATFLILLAVGVGVADERPLVIVGVMAAGWLLVALVELLAWRAGRRVSPVYAEPEPVVEELHGWDVAEIIAPQAPEPPPEVELTTVLPPAGESEEVRPRRRLFGRRKGE
jgi:hypothetical protein